MCAGVDVSRVPLPYEGGDYGGTTNKTWLTVLFSVKNRKFIRGYMHGDRVSGGITYRLYAGRYLEFRYYRWSKRDPPALFEVSEVVLSPSKRGDRLTEKERKRLIRLEWYKWKQLRETVKDRGWVGIVDHFVACLPAYHSRPDTRTLMSKVFTEEEVRAIFGDKGFAACEGAEFE